MEPEPGNPNELEGVLNPAAARGPDGYLYLFPRLVAAGNYSRIGIARVQFNDEGDPTGVERLGIALEPEAEYELRPDGRGGCEDPRVTFRGTARKLCNDLHGLLARSADSGRFRHLIPLGFRHLIPPGIRHPIPPGFGPPQRHSPAAA